MLSLLTVTIIETLISITSGSCPYVASYYYEYDSGATSSTGVELINQCSVSYNSMDGIHYNSEKFTCINDEVYINMYTDEQCTGTPGFTTNVGPVPTDAGWYNDYRAPYTFSCDESGGCSNYIEFRVSNQSYYGYYQNGDTPPVCPDHADDTFIEFPPFLINICMDNSYGNSSMPDSSSKWTCDDTGAYYYEYVGSTSCAGSPETTWVNANGCGDGEALYLYTQLTYCDGVSYDGTSIGTPKPTAAPTKQPTFSPTKPSVAPTKAPTGDTSSPTKMPSNAPTGDTSSPTKMPTISPTETTHAPSAAPTGNTYAPTPDLLAGDQRLSYTFSMMFVVFCMLVY